MLTFGEWLAEELKRLGITQADLATRMKKPPATVSRVVSGTRQPGIDFLTSLVRALPQIPGEEICERAGILRSGNLSSQITRRMTLSFSRLSVEQQKMFLDMLNGLERERDIRSETVERQPCQAAR